jgi:hypothetical protein
MVDMGAGFDLSIASSNASNFFFSMNSFFFTAK